MAEATAEQPKPAQLKGRRVKILVVNPADFMFLFTKGLEFRKRTKIIEGLPDDAQLIAVAAEPIRHAIMLVVKSQSFPMVAAEQMPPFVPVEIQTQFGGTKKKKK
jgi:hypothetical protein